MGKYFKGLFLDNQLEFVYLDIFDIVDFARKTHIDVPCNIENIAKSFLSCAYMTSLLKDEKHVLSLSIKTNGENFLLVSSGNRSIKGYFYMENTQLNSFVVIKDIGLKEPYTGTSIFDGDIINGLKTYYKVSEQQDLFYKIEIDMENEKVSALFINPLPFANNYQEYVNELLSKPNPFEILKGNTLESGEINFNCDCSTEQIERVLISVGKSSLIEMVKELGEIKVVCPYCKKEYKFLIDDIKGLF